jgi:hypothetical protein
MMGELNLPEGLTICIGVVADHEDELADELLVRLMAMIMSLPTMPLLAKAIRSDCYVTPIERGNAHVEMRWIVV